VALTQRTVGTGYVALRGLTTFNGALLAGNDNGELVSISPTTGIAALIGATGLGTIVSVVADGAVGLPVFATTANQVWRFPNYTTPLFTSPLAILELSPGRKAQPAALAFGTGCPGTLGVASFVFTGYPAIPTPGFQLQLTNVKPTTVGAFVLGASRTRFLSLPLPLDLGVINMPGCWLYQDMLMSLPFVSDAVGGVSSALPIPPNPALGGGRITAQGYAFDLAQNSVGITTEGYELILY
jgi:hypothetical protein